MVSNLTIQKRTAITNTTLSPGRKILYIVEHYTAGTTSKAGAAANTASWFMQPKAAASADFIVDDLNIVQYNPDPANRYCWAVGGGKYSGTKGGGTLYGVVTNKNSISIEICSTNSAGKVTATNDKYWSFTDAVLQNAEKLTKYLMEKYGIDADHVIRHYDITGKSCPGIIGWNAETGDESKWRAFKARLTASSGTASTDTPAPVSAASVPVTDEAKVIWDFLKEKGLSDCAVAGIMGNIYAESGLKATNLQNSFEKSLKMTDAEYTAAVDSGEYDNFVRDGAGYGYFQWTWWSRKDRLLAFARETGRSIGDPAMQLDFFWNELQSDYPGAVNALKIASSVLEASNVILFQYERPADQGEAVQQKRAAYGEGYFKKYAFAPYLVRVTIPDLYIRKGPGTDTPALKFCPPGAYTIVEEREGPGAPLWGRLKSGEGWIALKHTTKV